MSPSIIIAAFDPTEPTSTPAVMTSLFFHFLSDKTRWYSCQRQYSTSSFMGVSFIINAYLTRLAATIAAPKAPANSGYSGINTSTPSFLLSDATKPTSLAAPPPGTTSGVNPNLNSIDETRQAIEQNTPREN